VIFELWDYDTRNIIYAYRTEADVLAEVAERTMAFGLDAVRTYILLSNDGTENYDGLQRIAGKDGSAKLSLMQRILRND
jgi:translation elongation factor EF-1beta